MSASDASGAGAGNGATACWRLTEALLREHGDAIALDGAADPVSYSVFAGRALAVADALDAANVQPGDPVAILSAGRRHDEPVALAGVLIAGAIAIPLDAASPPQRLAAILEARRCRAIVHDEKAAKKVLALDCAATVELDHDGFVASGHGLVPGEAQPGDTEVACILHTSGSTGTPKPVPLRWEGLDAFTGWMADLTRLATGTRVLRVAELTFDLAWFDHLATWRAGATLCTTTRRQLAAGRSLRSEIDRLGPQVIYGVPSLFMKLVDASVEPLGDALHTLCFAGEIYPPAELRRLADCATQARLFNLYGPTETNVCTYHAVDRAHLDGASETPIGLACPYATCELRDADGAVLEGPGTGELVVHGPTALHGEVATRDAVERRDGVFYFRGRLDRVVKVRGYRVDPGEVEAVLRTHSSVREAAVVVDTHPRLGKILRAVVTSRPEAGASAGLDRELRAFAAQQLAPYMVPERVDVTDDLPRTSTGKIDYQALA